MAPTHPAPASLQALFSADQPVYLLIDPIVGDFLPQLAFADTSDAESIRGAREDVLGRRVLPITLAPSIQLPPARHPYLVAMEAVDDPWLAASQEMALEQHATTCAPGLAGTGWGTAKVGGWLQSARRGETLAETLARWMLLKTEARTHARYLRLADPRVLALLVFVLGRERLIAAMGGLRRWVFLDAHGRLDALHNPDSGEAGNDPIPLPRLNRVQWDILENGPAIHGAIAQAWGQRRKDGGPVTSGHAQIPYAEAISAANAFPARPHASDKAPGACASLEDRCTAIALALLHPGWDNHPEVQRHLAENAQAYSLSDLAEELHEILHRAAAEADPTKATLGTDHEH